MTSRNVLIAGCGDLGIRVAERVRAAGGTAWGLRRRVDRLPSWVRPIEADLATGEGLDAIIDDALTDLSALDLVVYAASADRYDDDAYRRAYVDGPRHLLAALGTRRPRWLHVSSTSVYGQRDGSRVDEESPTVASSFSAERLLEGEELVASSGLVHVVLRLAGIYGPGRTRLLDSARDGTVRCSNPSVYTNRIHIDDAADALLHLAALDDPAPLYLGVDHQPALDCDVKTWLCRRLGRPDPPTDDAEDASSRSSSRSRAMRSNKRCSSRRLRASGFRFRYPDYRTGYDALIRSTAQTANDGEIDESRTP